jgi:hypothetical protein
MTDNANNTQPISLHSGLFIKALALLVTAAGLAVMTGWIFDIAVLKSLSPAWVTMKFTTAVSFAASGISLFFIVRMLEGEFDTAQVVLSLASLVLALLMGLLFCSTVFGISTGIESLFIKETGEVKTVAPGHPSLPTMINFLLIALAAILALQHPARLKRKLGAIGLILVFTGALATAGYIFNAPLLYYYIEQVNTAMALHTALLFVILGTGLLCL